MTLTEFVCGGIPARAHDTKLKRDVALKILPTPFASDPARLARFEREAQALAALNHPHIAAIYGLGHTDQTRFLVLELVEGPTLADRLSTGPLQVGEALRITTEIAEAMEASHEKGVIHRDLKPANVKLTANGDVKVLDFGLAKALGDFEPAAWDPANSPTLTIRETQPGIVLGTAAYMSPEQANNKPVDKRTDIWSFGVVLYEMLAGRKAFDGKTVSHIIVHVLEQEPDWSALPPLPPGVREILERCLQKDPANRLRDIGDVRVLLQAAIARPFVTHEQGSGRRLTGRRSFLAQGAVGAAVLGLGWVYLRREPPRATVLDSVRYDFHPPEGTLVAGPLALSPDGRNIAFIASRPGEGNRLWIGSLESNTSRPLEGATVNSVPIWSHDSRYIAYSSAGKLYRIDLAGAPPQPLCPVASNVIGGFWTSDNKIVFASIGNGLQQVSAAGGTAAPLTTLTNGEFMHASPSLLPDGRRFVYIRVIASNINAYVGSLDDPPDVSPGKPLLTDVARVVYADSPDPRTGYLLYVHGSPNPATAGTLMTQPIDIRDLAFSGDAMPVAEQVLALSVSSSTTGRLVYSHAAGGATGVGFAPGMVQGQLTWFNRKGTVVGKIAQPGWYRTPSLSPDESKVALEVVDSEIQNMDIHLFEFGSGVRTRFSFSPNRDYIPVWSPDGTRVVYASERPDGTEWYEKPSSLAGEERLVLKLTRPGGPTAWARNGFILYSDLAAPSEIRAMDTNAAPADRKPIPVTNSESNDINARLSPDEKLFTYASNESGRFEIWVRPFNPSSFGSPSAPKWMVSKNGAREGGAVWRGNEIFYISADQKMMVVKVTTDPVFQEKGVATELFPVPQGVLFFDVSRDGQRFLMPLPAASTVTQSPFKVIVDWTATLRK